MKYKIYRPQKNQYIHQVMAYNGSLKLMLAKIILQLCYQKIMNDILPITIFHSFFIHNSCYILNNEIWILQTWKSQYIQQVMPSNGSLKLMLAKIILQLCYLKFKNVIIPIILFHSFIFSWFILNYKQWNMNFTNLKKLIYSPSYGI